MYLERQYPEINRHRKEGRIPCAAKGQFSWLDVAATACIALPFLVMGLHLLKGLMQ